MYDRGTATDMTHEEVKPPGSRVTRYEYNLEAARSECFDKVTRNSRAKSRIYKIFKLHSRINYTRHK